MNCAGEDARIVTRVPTTTIDLDDTEPPMQGWETLVEAAAVAIADGVSYNSERGNGSVYVHCSEGVGRSPACVITFLVRHRAMAVVDAIDMVQTARPVACPSPSYLAPLFAKSVTGDARGGAPTLLDYTAYYWESTPYGQLKPSFADWLSRPPPPVPPRRRSERQSAVA